MIIKLSTGILEKALWHEIASMLRITYELHTWFLFQLNSYYSYRDIALAGHGARHGRVNDIHSP